MGQSTNDMFPTAIHVAVGRGDQGATDSRSAALHKTLADKGASSGTTSSRSAARTWPTPRRFAWGRNSAALPGSWSCRSTAPVARSKQSSSCPPAAPPSAPASTRIPSSAAASPRCSPRRPACRSSKRRTISRPTPSATAWSSASGQLRDDRRHAVQRRQQHPLARQRPALRLLRDHASRPPARQLDHAGQGQPGDVREHDAGRRLRHGQRPDRRHSPARRAASSSSTS